MGTDYISGHLLCFGDLSLPWMGPWWVLLWGWQLGLSVHYHQYHFNWPPDEHQRSRLSYPKPFVEGEWLWGIDPQALLAHVYDKPANCHVPFGDVWPLHKVFEPLAGSSTQRVFSVASSSWTLASVWSRSSDRLSILSSKLLCSMHNLGHSVPTASWICAISKLNWWESAACASFMCSMHGVQVTQPFGWNTNGIPSIPCRDTNVTGAASSSTMSLASMTSMDVSLAFSWEANISLCL